MITQTGCDDNTDRRTVVGTGCDDNTDRRSHAAEGSKVVEETTGTVLDFILKKVYYSIACFHEYQY